MAELHVGRLVSRQALAALVAVQVLYGMLPAAGKTVFKDLDPLGMTWVRITGGTLLILLIHQGRGGRWPTWGMWPGIARLALFGVIVNMGLFALGLQRTHPVNATLLITTIPVFTYIVAVAMGKETLGPRRLFGILMALSGAVYLIGLSGFEASLETAIGDVLVLLNALSFSIFLVISKRWTQEHDPFDVTVWILVVAAIVFLPIGLMVDGWGQLSAASGQTLGWMGFVIVGPTVLAYWLNSTALRRVPSSTVAVFIYLQPPISAMAAWWVLGIAPSPSIIPAALLILAGVTLVSLLREKRAAVAVS